MSIQEANYQVQTTDGGQRGYMAPLLLQLLENELNSPYFCPKCDHENCTPLRHHDEINREYPAPPSVQWDVQQSFPMIDCKKHLGEDERGDGHEFH